MGMTTIKVHTEERDQLARIAKESYGGATLRETLTELIREHEEREVLQQYERLKNDPEEWASYMEEVHEWERAGWADLSKRMEQE